ncbi:MAG: hypothetical protein AB7P76_06340 [Candidatus Melainabacteria bacterium]
MLGIALNTTRFAITKPVSMVSHLAKKGTLPSVVKVNDEFLAAKHAYKTHEGGRLGRHAKLWGNYAKALVKFVTRPFTWALGKLNPKNLTKLNPAKLAKRSNKAASEAAS